MEANKINNVNIEVRLRYETISIYINGSLHLRLKHIDEIISIESWKTNDADFSIEYTYRSGVKIRTQYDSIEKIKFILNEIDKIP